MPVCPVCTVAVCAGLGLSRWLGVDDLISGAWIGGLLVSFSFLVITWFNRKKIIFKFRNFLIFLFIFLSTYLSLLFTKVIGQSVNKFCGLDRLLFGILAGSLIFSLGVWLNSYLKKINQNKAYFPFQKVIIPIAFLLMTTLVLYLVK